jgi:hypothetical protein
MDNFQLVAVIFGFASVTTWFALHNAKETGKLKELRFEALMVAIAWIAAALITVWALR